MDDFEAELKGEFLNEAVELIESAENSFVELESNPNSEEILDHIFRFAHNLKGTSRAVGFDQVARFTHEFENLVLKIKKGETEVTPYIISLLLECSDFVKELIFGLKENLDFETDDSKIIEKLKQALEGAVDGKNTEDLSTSPEINSISPESIEEVALEPAVDLQGVNDNTPPPPQNKSSKANRNKIKSSAGNDEFIRVALNKIDLLNNYVGELVLLQTVLDQRGDTVIKDRLAIDSIRQLTKISKEIQEISMSMRMIPIKATFQKMNRIVRDTALTLGKKVNLQIEGDHHEIDKTILEKLVDPLVHMVRNSVDHGVESPEIRVESGKAPEGNIHLRAYHQGNYLVVEITDDGKGIDPEVIERKAIEKSVIQSANKLSSSELLQLIFHPGFSTKDEVSEVSGRGVGMDVVKTNIEDLGGEVQVSSELGKGSCFKIKLPLTLAIIDGIVAKVNSQRYIFQVSQIKEIIRPTKEMKSFVTGVGECVTLRGDTLPVFDLSEDLHRGKSETELENSILFVCHFDSHKFAIRVDDLINQQSVVVKNIGPDVRDQRGFMGGSILGDGKPAFILDLEEFYVPKLKTISNSFQNRIGA